jgi:hypothetical protein
MGFHWLDVAILVFLGVRVFFYLSLAVIKDPGYAPFGWVSPHCSLHTFHLHTRSHSTHIARVPTRSNMYMNTRTYTLTHTYNKRIFTYTHAYTHTHTHTHIHMRTCTNARSPCTHVHTCIRIRTTVSALSCVHLLHTHLVHYAPWTLDLAHLAHGMVRICAHTTSRLFNVCEYVCVCMCVCV